MHDLYFIMFAKDNQFYFIKRSVICHTYKYDIYNQFYFVKSSMIYHTALDKINWLSFANRIKYRNNDIYVIILFKMWDVVNNSNSRSQYRFEWFNL